MKQKIRTHLHKFQRFIIGGRKVVYFTDDHGKRKRRIDNSGGYEVYKCMFPGCRTYIATEMAPGSISVCWSCGEELILNSENLKLKRPTHEECRRKRVMGGAA